MYKMIIVDDEQYSREGMKKILRWEKFDIEIAAVSDSAKSGIEAARKYKPDIVITDIKMNSMDGLEMIEEIKKFLKCEFIVISGYSVFEYAQRAINADVTNYLLKPVSRVDLEAAILKCIAKIRANTAQSLAEQLGSCEYIIDMLMNENMNAGELISFDEYFLYIVRSKNALVTKFHDKIEIFRKLENAYICFTNQYELAVVSQKEKNFDFLGDCFIGLCRGKASESFKNVYKNAVCALNQAVRESKHICEFSDNTVVYMNEFYNDAYNDIVLLLESGDIELAKNEILRTFQRARKENVYYSDIISWSEKLFYTILDLIKKEAGAQCTEQAEKHFKVVLGDKSVFDFSVCDCILDLCDIYDTDGENISAHGKDKKIEEVVKYVDEHYCEDISLKWLANNFWIEHKYLSKLFKKYVNEGYVEYITKKRINAAKKMLSESELTIAEIAEKVSYDDTNYFTVVFKRNVGITPREYRIKHFKAEGDNTL